MKTIKMLALAAAATMALAAPAMAATITYTFTGTFSGVNGGPFTNVDATFTGIADTNNVTTNGFSFYTQLSSLQAVSPTAGVFNITDPSFFYINPFGYAGLEFGAFDDTSFFSGNNDALIGYDGKSSVATTPIEYFSGINATFNTDRGSVTITQAVNGTFAASVAGAVPEPATWAMMIGGFGMVGGAMRRRRVSTKFNFA
jgi:hypothetical protein